MLSAAGCFGSPGMVSTVPVMTTRNPAPSRGVTSRTLMVKPDGAPALGVIGKTVLGLGHADRQVSPAVFGDGPQRQLRLVIIVDTGAAVYLGDNRVDLIFDCIGIGVKRLEVSRLLEGLQQRIGQRQAALAAFAPNVGRNGSGAFLLTKLDQEFDLGRRVRREFIDADNHRHPVALHVVNVALQIGKTAFQRGEIFRLQVSKFLPAVVLKGADGGNDDDRIRGFAQRRGGDVHKLFTAQSAPKPASVSAMSPISSAARVAMIELQPCAMLANGPP